MVKLDKAMFYFHDEGGTTIVAFRSDEKGKPADVVLIAPGGGEDILIDNPKGEWKPCVTHCRDLIRWWKFGRPPMTEFAKQRVQATKPKFRVVSE